MSAERRLAAIVAADVVGYSRLMGEDEVGTARAVREHREAARPLVTAHGGRIVKTLGDGVLLEFPSVVAAVECAIAVQKLMTERNADVPEPRRIVYRIGVHLGDVLIEGDDILGDGVNIAARLETIAPPGGITLSEDAYRQVRGKVAAEFADLGEVELKNIVQPVRAFAIASGAGVAVPGGRARSAPHLSIVVLPFANISGDPEQEYFVDGVTESLTTDLSRIDGSFVIARNTAFTYKGKPINARQIGRDLNIRYVLEGSVQRGGNRLRVNVQLINAESGDHLWADRFDKPVADLFDMQDEIVARLARQLDGQLFAAEARRTERSLHPDSMDLFFQGMAWFNKGFTAEFMTRAHGSFERALQLDPEDVLSLTWLAGVNLVIGSAGLTDDQRARFATAEAALTKALSLAPNYSFAHFWLGYTQTFSNRPIEGIASLQHALSLDPNLAAASPIIGAAKYFTGHAEETEAWVNEALRLSPRDTFVFVWLGFVGFSKLLLGRDEEAVGWLRRSIESNRNFPWAHFHLAAALANLDRLAEAQAAARAGLALNPAFTIRRWQASDFSDNPVYLAGRARVTEALRKVGIPEG
jgi:TolB-like protein/class 3 adenylate cyclase